MMNLSGKVVAIVGLGESGVAAVELALRSRAEVVAIDSAPQEKWSPAARALAEKGVKLFAGRNDGAAMRRADVVVVSPGVPSLPALDEASASGTLVIGELEFAARQVDAPIVAVGGTNGKSTTTALVHRMLVEQGKKAFIGANFGRPLSTAVGETYDVLVLEVSSFQMERAPTFHPRVAALLNITEDHLDRYPSFQAYAAAKGNMFQSQSSDDVAVVPRGDVTVAREAGRGDGRLITFGPGGDIGLDGDGRAIVDRLRDERYPVDAIRLRGAHNLLNVSAAIACAAEAGAAPAAIRAALAAFEGLAHRTAFVSEIGGVRYYDDSKGTNVGAAVSALRGLEEPRVVLIAGGRDKRGSYDALRAELAKKGRGVVLIGEAAHRIAEAVNGAVPVEHASSMDEAVEKASALAEAGDAVLLSPACSSFDMFRDYKDRGDAFARAVHARAGSRTTGGAR
jgi:UDP-N-acetylmuramoylalanine--D-glutamate ligase